MKRIIVALLIILFSVMVYAKTCKYSANGVKVSCVSKGITTFYNKDGGVRKKISKNVGAVMKRPVKVKLSGTRKEIKYYANKQIRYIQYWRNNIKHGDDIGYYKNGKMWWKTTWKNGKVDGEFIKWDDTGKQTDKSIYINGERVSCEVDGNLGIFKNGKLHKSYEVTGQILFFDIHGNIEKIIFKNGDIKTIISDHEFSIYMGGTRPIFYIYGFEYVPATRKISGIQQSLIKSHVEKTYDEGTPQYSKMMNLQIEAYNKIIMILHTDPKSISSIEMWKIVRRTNKITGSDTIHTNVDFTLFHSILKDSIDN